MSSSVLSSISIHLVCVCVSVYPRRETETGRQKQSDRDNRDRDGDKQTETDGQIPAKTERNIGRDHSDHLSRVYNSSMRKEEDNSSESKN